MKYLPLVISLFTLFACRQGSNSNERFIQNNVIQSLAKYGVDQSPMDMIYLPVDYPKLKIQQDYNRKPICRVIYSRPQKNGRTIFGEVIPFDKPWRLGANEATEIEFFQQASINGQTIEVGRYVMYCIPQEKEWKIVLNKDLYTWGLKIDSTQDYLSVSLPVEKLTQAQEIFTMEFLEEQGENYLVIAWDESIVYLPIVTL
jgi:hypothetical protein